MTEEISTEPIGDTSKIIGVSIRGWLVVIMVLTMCGMSVFMLEIKEPLYSSILLGLGFYFGQAKKG